MDVQLVAEDRREGPPPNWLQEWCGVLTHTHTFSGRDDHGGAVAPPESYQHLSTWAQRCGVAAIGMGSPYTPKSARKFDRYDGPERDCYYQAGFDKLSVLDGDEVEAMLGQANRCSSGRPLFYLDNETPKGRYGHMWWVGYHADLPPWHDYDQPFDRWMLDPARAGDHRDEPMAYERRPYLQILAVQRAQGALAMWAHPTSWWRGEAGQFITNIASEMPVHAMAEGFLYGLVVMGYHPFRPEYQALWFELLDRGYRVPGVAEMDCGLSDARLWQQDGAMLTYVPRPPGALSLRELTAAFRSGPIFASSGPMVDLQVDGQRVGDVALTGPDMAHQVHLTAHPRPGHGRLGRVELLGPGGEVLWREDEFGGGTVDLRVSGLRRCGYLIARVFGAGADRVSGKQIREFAISNPVYLHPAGQTFTRPLSTDVHLIVRPDSPFHGGEVRFETMNGRLLCSAVARGRVRQRLPATARVTLVPLDPHPGRCRTDYLINASPAVQAAQRHLYRGRFLLDHPHLAPGEVPPGAWRLDDYAAALHAVELVY